MALRLWDDSYSIGIAEIDQQHKEMFGTMMGLHRAMLAGQSGQRIEPALLEMMRGCESHFRTEEALMAFHRFPDLKNHKSEHALITAQLQVFLADHKAGKPGLIVDLLEYLEDWQGIHVLQHDMKYRDYLMQQWGIQFKGDALAHVEVRRSEQDGRRFPRLVCSVPVELHSVMDAPIVFAKCVNISQTGAFLRTWSPLRVNTAATARFCFGDSTAEVRVSVRRSEPCIGMGISFLGPVPQRLQHFIGDLEKTQARSQADPTELTCERLLHDCMQNLSALEDVLSDANITAGTAAAVHGLLTRAHNLQRLAARK